MAGRIILVGGGARSGKTSFAMRLARKLGPKRIYLATAEPLDEEMRERIRRHREDRGDDFITVEEPREVGRRLAELDECDAVLVDCLTLWLSNLLGAQLTPAQALSEVDALLDAVRGQRFDTILVTNEVGMGMVPLSPLGRAFCDLSGQAHQRIAREAHEIYAALLGLILRIHPEPVQRVHD